MPKIYLRKYIFLDLFYWVANVPYCVVLVTILIKLHLFCFCRLYFISNTSDPSTSFQSQVNINKDSREVVLSQDELFQLESKSWLGAVSTRSTDVPSAPPNYVHDASNSFQPISANYNNASTYLNINATPFRSAKKTLLHAIRLQVINGKKVLYL